MSNAKIDHLVAVYGFSQAKAAEELNIDSARISQGLRPINGEATTLQNRICNRLFGLDARRFSDLSIEEWKSYLAFAPRVPGTKEGDGGNIEEIVVGARWNQGGPITFCLELEQAAAAARIVVPPGMESPAVRLKVAPKEPIYTVANSAFSKDHPVSVVIRRGELAYYFKEATQGELKDFKIDEEGTYDLLYGCFSLPSWVDGILTSLEAGGVDEQNSSNKRFTTSFETTTALLRALRDGSRDVAPPFDGIWRTVIECA